MATRRRLLRGGAVLTVVGATPGCLDDLGTEPGPGPSPDTEASPVDERVRAHERAIHERVNEVRREHDLGRLEYDEDIARVARRHSADMADRDYFAHESPEGEGPEDRLEDFFPEHCRKIGENLANVGLKPEDDPETVAERVVSGWMDSPGHRENVLRQEFDEEGVGVAFTDADRVLATQNFCATRDGFAG